MKSYLHAFTGTGADVDEDVFANAEGNNLGSWITRLNWNDENIEVGAYLDHFFEDHSGMFFMDYDGYGSGSEWNERKENRYFRYDMKDALVGIDVKLKKFRYINQAVVEYVNTRYQSGPIYHDHNSTNSTHISGRDNFYNHYTLSGWQHWGQVIGNPLYLSPIYNDDGFIGTHCNRFKAWHFAFAGNPLKGLYYRAKMSWQRGWGNYDNPYMHPKVNTSILFETSYMFPEESLYRHFTLHLAYGADFGKLRGNNSGIQTTIRYHIK